MKKREAVTIAINALSEDGCGYSEDGKFAVYGSIAGEVVSAIPLTRKRQRLYLNTTEVLEASPDRVEPACAAASVCGGCSFQHMTQQSQLTLKSQYLKEQLAPLEPVEWLDPVLGSEFQYRTKARLGVKFVEKKGRLLVGFREKQKPFIADIDHCPILAETCGQLIGDLEGLIGQLSIMRAVPQVELAAGDEAVALVFRHLEPFSDNDYETLKLFSETTGYGIYLQPSGPESVVQAFPESGAGTLSYSVPEFELTFDFAPLDFTQVNLGVNRQMISLAHSLLDLSEADHVLDAFCGIGNFSLALARSAGRVTGLELSAQSIARAELNALANNIKNVAFSVADLHADPLELPVEVRFNKVLLDPPRSGAEALVKGLATRDIERVVYVSCNPESIARDANILCDQGFTLQTAGIINMFPHTTHVESIASFRRQT